MTIQDRYDDIAKRTGFSEEIIREVFKATKASLVESLKNQEHCLLPGICYFDSEIYTKFDVMQQRTVETLRVKVKVSQSFQTEIDNSAEIERRKKEKEKEIKNIENKISYKSVDKVDLSYSEPITALM